MLAGVPVRVALVLAVAGLAPSLAHAQSSSEVAAARSLFQEGLAAAREGRWEHARDRFERSYAIAPRPNTLLNLAGAQVQTGQLVAGAESYRRFLAEARSGAAARYRPQAEEALAEVERRIARLTVSVEGLTEADTVTLDGDELARAALGIEIPVDPGTRTIVVHRGDAERAREIVTLAEGERREITIDVSVDLRVADERSRAQVPEAALRADAEAAGGDDGAWIGVGVAVGVLVAAGVAVGVALAVDAASATYAGNLGPGVLYFE